MAAASVGSQAAIADGWVPGSGLTLLALVARATVVDGTFTSLVTAWSHLEPAARSTAQLDAVERHSPVPTVRMSRYPIASPTA